MKRLAVMVLCSLPWLSATPADLASLMEPSTLQAFAGEISGVAAKRNLDRITLYHRTRASKQFRQARPAQHSRLAGGRIRCSEF